MSKRSLTVAPRSGGERGFFLAAIALFVWLLVWIRLSWPYLLDDALIHLRYADHLLHQHRITYDGVHASFGTSSLLYVCLLAFLSQLWTSPLLPRVVSSLVYVVLFALLALVLARGLRQQARPSAGVWLLATSLLAVMVAPSAVRWLDDGMETGLVFLDALLGVLLTRGLLHEAEAGRRARAAWVIWAFVYGLLTVLLRVELLLLAGAISAMALVGGLGDRTGTTKPGKRWWAALMPAAGGLAGAGVIVFTQHALLPDTALAKAFGTAAWQQTLSMTAVTVASSFSFGLGLLVLWSVSFVALLVGVGLRATDAVPNLLFPFVLLASAYRGQQIQGIRYFGWTLFFPLLWNLFRCAEAPPQRPPALARALQVFGVVFLAALLPAFAWEGRTFLRLFQGRSAALNTFRAQHLESLRGQRGIAEDVGFVGYFTQGDICDPYGLVNGRAAARLRYEQRFARCMALHPVFAFGSVGFLQKVTHVQRLAGWSVCGSYPFDNVRSRDVHYLVVAPEQVQTACAASAVPVADVLPGLL